MLEKLFTYMQYPFVQKAFIVGILIALCSSLFGVTLVTKRLSFIGDGLSHTAFGAMAVASVVGLTNKMIIVLPVTVIAAILLLKPPKKSKIGGDAIVAMISVGALALGYLLMNLFSSSSNISGDVCATLFGSTAVLTLTQAEVYICIILSVITITLYVLLYNKIFAITFDEGFAKATGVKTQLYNTVIAVIIAVIIVLAMNLVGSLLISALIIFPSISAMRVCKSYKGVNICSAVVTCICTIIGISLSVIYGTPVGSTVVAADIIAFALFFAIGKIKEKTAK